MTFVCLDLDSARHTVGPNGFKPETADCFGGDGKTTANERGGERFTASWQMAKSTRAEESLCFCSSKTSMHLFDRSFRKCLQCIAECNGFP